MSGFKHARIAALTGALALWALPATAQDASTEPADDQPEIRGGAYVIKGKLQKPEVTVLVRRKSLDVGVDLSLDRTFLNRVSEALQDEALAD